MTFFNRVKSVLKKITILRKIKYKIVSIINPLLISQVSLKKIMIEQSKIVTGSLLDIGCGSKPYESLFKVNEYFSVDYAGNSNADVIGDGMKLPIKSGIFDTVISNEVLEHVPNPQCLMNEAYRVLKPGGTLILTTPQTWGLHHEPYDFYRYTKYGLQHLSETAGFEVINIFPTTGFISTYIQRIADVILHHYALSWPYVIRFILQCICAPFLWFGLFIEAFVRKKGDTLDNVLVARKPYG